MGNCDPELLHFEVFDKNGHLLSRFDPFKDYVMLRIVGNKMLLRDKDKISLLVYEIVDI